MNIFKTSSELEEHQSRVHFQRVNSFIVVKVHYFRIRITKKHACFKEEVKRRTRWEKREREKRRREGEGKKGKKDWKSARDSTRSQDPYAIPGLEIRETASRATPFSFGVSARATTGTWCREIKFNGVSLDEHRSPSAYEHVFVNATTEQSIPRNWKFNRILRSLHRMIRSGSMKIVY